MSLQIYTMSMEDLCDQIDAAAPPPGRPRAYKKRQDVDN